MMLVLLVVVMLARPGVLVTQRPWVARVSPVTRVEEGRTALLPCRLQGLQNV